MTQATVKQFNFDELDRGTRFVKLVTPIDEHEMSALAVEAAQASKSIDSLKDERKGLNADIKSLEEKRDEALKAVGTGKREKEVQCEIGYDWANGRKYTRRLDTQQLIDENGEPITDDERQMQLEGLDAKRIIAEADAEADDDPERAAMADGSDDDAEKCDGDHAAPACSDPDCWRAGYVEDGDGAN
jgi:hypothetical protein